MSEKGLKETLKSNVIEFSRDGFPMYKLQAPICQIWISGLYGSFTYEVMKPEEMQVALANLVCRFYCYSVYNNALPPGNDRE